MLEIMLKAKMDDRSKIKMEGGEGCLLADLNILCKRKKLKSRGKRK